MSSLAASSRGRLGEGCGGFTFVWFFSPSHSHSMYSSFLQLLSWEEQKAITLFPASQGQFLGEVSVEVTYSGGIASYIGKKG